MSCEIAFEWCTPVYLQNVSEACLAMALMFSFYTTNIHSTQWSQNRLRTVETLLMWIRT